MNRYSSDWCQRANELLAPVGSGTVPEFSLVLSVTSSTDDTAFHIRIENSRLLFDSTRSGTPDVFVEMPSELIDALVLTGEYAALVQRLPLGSVKVDGDWAKARYFERGLFRADRPDLHLALANL